MLVNQAAPEESALFQGFGFVHLLSLTCSTGLSAPQTPPMQPTAGMLHLASPVSGIVSSNSHMEKL